MLKTAICFLIGNWFRLKELKDEYPSINVGRIKNEWVWHNIAYALHYKIESSKSVDVHFNAPDDIWYRALFFELFRFWG